MLKEGDYSHYYKNRKRGDIPNYLSEHLKNKDPNSFKTQYESIKEKCLREKYVIATGCFQLATQICVSYFFFMTHFFCILSCVKKKERKISIHQNIE